MTSKYFSTGESSRDFAINQLHAIKHDNGSYIDYHDTQRWYNDIGELHRDDGPAVVYPDGGAYWYLYGGIHSLNTWLKLTSITDEQKLLLRLQYD
jgi:hypothetical protein